jgi:hypothetical protein
MLGVVAAGYAVTAVGYRMAVQRARVAPADQPPGTQPPPDCQPTAEQPG